MSGLASEPKHASCPCGRESILGSNEHHALGRECAARVERHVRRRFSRQLWGGRFIHLAEDVVQEIYLMLLRPGGLDTFQYPPGRERADAFHGWLYCVVRNRCRRVIASLVSHPDTHGESVDSLEERPEHLTPEEVFTRQHVMELVDLSVEQARKQWQHRLDRFEALLPVVLGREPYVSARTQLGLKDGHLRVLAHELRRSIGRAFRRFVRDGLRLAPGMTAREIDQKVDDEIVDLFVSASFEGINLDFFVPADTDPEREP